ncbi:MAG: GntR family transcriptional regulator [Herbinix sp.]|nr:GntR family transcriptional regulator [Herbinix sp.]
MELNASSTISLFEQLKSMIKEQIVQGIYTSGQKIPTEVELSEQYNVSRITVRRAIEELVKDGVLVKKQGKGTFVQENKITRKIEHTVSFSEACLANGMKPTSIISKRKIFDPDAKLKDEMGSFNGQKVLYIQRIRYADRIPVMCENNYYPYEKYAFLMEETLDTSLYEVLTNNDIQIGSPRDSYIDVLRATNEMSKLLEISIGEPLFYLHTKMYDTNNELIHLGKQYIVGSRYRFYYDEDK